MRYHHCGIPTDQVRDGETHLPEYGLHVSGFEDSPFGIEWMRFDEDSPLPDIVRTVPHVAFEVDDLEAALEGHEVIIQPNSPSEGLRVAFVLHNGAPVEFLCFSPETGRGDPPRNPPNPSGGSGAGGPWKAMAVSALLLLGAAACRAQNTPEPRWEYITPSAAGLDAGLMTDLEESVTAGRFTNLHAVIVAKGGQLVVEAYAPGVESDELHYTASVTKSVGSLLLGVAMDRGLLPGLDAGALDLALPELFPEHRDVIAADSLKRDIRLRHILSMTGGLEWDEDSYPYDDDRNDWARIRDAEDPVRMVLHQPVVAAPGSAFVYSGGMSTLVGVLLDRATGGDPRAFAERELFGPLGISEYEWWDLVGGLIDVPGGLHLRPLDMARIGQMMLEGGTWRGRTIVSKEWIAASTDTHVANRDSPDYGLHWWVGDHYYRGRSVHAALASGHGGQRIFVVPELDLVVVIVQQVFDNPWADANGLSVMGQYVLPAAGISEPDPTPVDPTPEQRRALAGVYESGRGGFTIEERGSDLWALADNAPPMQLVPTGPLRFRGTALGLVDVEFQFHVDGDGVVSGGVSSFGFVEDAFSRRAN